MGNKQEKQKVVFTRKMSKNGKEQMLLISIPVSVQPLLEFGKKYKVTMEEL